jgi:PadR family transcriptional regulator PadR
MDLLILQALVLKPEHCWAMSERVQQISSDATRIQQGSLYPALHRRERRGYELTKKGCRQLEVQKDAWVKLTAAMAQVLGTP